MKLSFNFVARGERINYSLEHLTLPLEVLQ